MPPEISPPPVSLKNENHAPKTVRINFTARLRLEAAGARHDCQRYHFEYYRDNGDDCRGDRFDVAHHQ
jgi:hypothetical protein